jgi:hypothetical protein
MRWYVSRNGETVGPVDDAQVTQWVRQGMHDAMVRDEHGGQWVRLSESPFRPMLPMHSRGLGGRVLVGAGMGALGLVCGAIIIGPIGALAIGGAAFAIGLVAGNVKIA